jgi:hypothetical protein
VLLLVGHDRVEQPLCIDRREWRVVQRLQNAVDPNLGRRVSRNVQVTSTLLDGFDQQLIQGGGHGSNSEGYAGVRAIDIFAN